jgi:hypothetical protein
VYVVDSLLYFVKNTEDKTDGTLPLGVTATRQICIPDGRDQTAAGMVKTTHNPVDPGEASAQMRPR